MNAPTASRKSPAAASLFDRFRRQIEAAENGGVTREDMTLRLTLRDTSQIQRDSSIPTEDISFAAGVMSILRVRVVSGGVPESILDLGEASAA